MVAAAVIGSAVVGAAASSAASNKASKAANRATDAQAAAADRQQQLAEDQWNRYLNEFGPLEDQLVQESKDFGSNANREKAAEEAGGAVTAEFANARSQLNSTPGLDPSSQRYLDSMTKLGISEAANKASAETGARRTVDDQGRARMQDAVALGKGLVSNASAGLSASAATAGAMGQSAAAAGQAAAQQGQAIGKMFGDITTNPAVQQGVTNWFSGGIGTNTGGTAAGTVSGGYVAPDGYANAGTVYNNPSAYVGG